MFQLRLPFEKGAPFQHLFVCFCFVCLFVCFCFVCFFVFVFSFFGCEILITMHSLNWWNQNYLGGPTTRSKIGENLHMLDRMSRPHRWIYHTHTPKKKKPKNKKTKQKQKQKQKNCRVPLHSTVPATITLFKGCPFPTLFDSLVAKFS